MTRPHSTLSFAATTLLAVSLLLVAGDARSCCPVSGDGNWVRLADQSVIIVWDAANKMEHFIRRASFNTEAKDFGFLVPTPTPPVIEEVNDSVFGLLKTYTAPTVEVDVEWVPNLCFCFAVAMGHKGSLDDGVYVLEEKRVGGMDAAVLQASDPAALGRWLEKYGYAKREALTEWLTTYVTKGWIITAFKYAGDASKKSVETKSVRMSFPAERPYFPYRVPKEQRDPEKIGYNPLRVFFLGANRVEGQLGPDAKLPWLGRTVWANRLSQANGTELLKEIGVSIEAPKGGWYLTEFLDREWPRFGEDDLFFSDRRDNTPVQRIRHIWIPVGDILVVLAVIALLVAVERYRYAARQVKAVRYR